MTKVGGVGFRFAGADLPDFASAKSVPPEGGTSLLGRGAPTRSVIPSIILSATYLFG